MGTGYTRNDTLNNIADGNVINASDIDGEYDAIEAAFNETTGHTHDGTAAEGAPITVLGPVQDFIASATEIKPKTTNTLDIGTVSLQFKDMYLDGTAYIDGLGEDILVATDKKVQFRDTALFINSSTDGQLDIDADVEVEITAPTLDIDASTAVTIDTATLTITGSANVVGDLDVDNININGNTIISTDTNGDINISPDGTGTVVIDTDLDVDNINVNGNTVSSTDTNGDINLSPNGTGTVVINTDLDVDNININGNTIISTDTNGNIALTPDGTGEVDISKVDIASGEIDGTTIGANSAAAGTFTTLSATTLGSAVDLNSQALTNANIDSGAIDGVTLGTNSAVTEAQVDNININGNTIISTDTNGNIALTPNGTGEVDISKVDIDSGAIDGTIIGANSAAAGTFTSLTASGDLTVDTNTLYVDSTNNRIGINNSSPQADIDIGGSSGNNLRFTGNNATGTGGIEFYNGDTIPAEIAAIGVLGASGTISIQSDPNNIVSSSRVEFDVDGSEIARFDASGLSFDNGSNHLDDYEEGTWTPTPETNSGTAASIATASGTYTKVGRLVTIIGNATNITPGGTAASIFRIGGLPFTPANQNSIGSAIWDNVSIQGVNRFYFAPVASTAGWIQFTQSGDAVGDTQTDHGDLDAGNTSDIEFTVTYMV